MALESVTHISDLVATNPTASDAKSQGDDHIRNIKSALKTDFPFISGVVTALHTELNYLVGVTSGVQGQINAKAPTASPTFTGTPAAPTAGAGTSTTQLATTAFVDTSYATKASPTFTGTVTLPATGSGSTEAVRKDYADGLVFATVLPAQTGNSGKFITTNGTTASWGPLNLPRVEITTDTTLDATHSGKLIIITSVTQRAITLPLLSATADGWFCYVQNKSTGSDWHNITKNAADTYAESSDGTNTWTNYPSYPEEVRMITKVSNGFKSVVLRSFNVTVLASVSFVRPPGYSAIQGLLWGGGGSGGRSGNASYAGSGGGGGACTPFVISKATFGGSQSIVIGAGGAARSGVGAGSVGGDSTLGSLVGAYGGGGGGYGDAANPTASGGGGGGSWSAGITGLNAGSTYGAYGGQPAQNIPGEASPGQGFGGAGGEKYSGSTFGIYAAYGGGGGGAFSGAGGGSVFGGGGGGSTSFGGPSSCGGAGGGGGIAGTVPAGGGGGTRAATTTSGAGAAGACVLWGVI